MNQRFLFLSGALLFLGGMSFWLYSGIVTSEQLVYEARNAGTDPEKWEAIFDRARSLPPIPPVAGVRNIFGGLEEGFAAAGILIEHMPQLGESISRNQAEQILIGLKDAVSGLERIQKGLNRIPSWPLDQNKQDLMSFAEDEIVYILDFMRVFEDIGVIINNGFENQSRVLILLQNTNEARPTGGFVGSLMILDFGKDDIALRFEDIYALDRLVPESAAFPAPEYYSPITPVISLRDANIYPEFERTADLYRHFFASIGEKEPDIVATLSLDFVRELMMLVEHPLYLEKWDMTFTPENADVLLSLLVESKAAGKMEVKTPVMDFGKALFSPEYLQDISLKKLFSHDWEAFLKQKIVLADSQNAVIDDIFHRWGIVQEFPKGLFRTDNFLSLDFTSVGANKSDRFIQNYMRHEQVILPNGIVENTISLDRTHTGTVEYIAELIREENIPAEIKSRITDETRWKLGSGENRSMVRLFIPSDSQKIQIKTPSGEGYTQDGLDKKMTVVHIPANVLPGETIQTQVTYETTIKKGSSAWRPYSIQYINPAAQPVTISSHVIPKDGTILEKSFSLGLPHQLINETLRAVISFDSDSFPQ